MDLRERSLELSRIEEQIEAKNQEIHQLRLQRNDKNQEILTILADQQYNNVSKLSLPNGREIVIHRGYNKGWSLSKRTLLIELREYFRHPRVDYNADHIFAHICQRVNQESHSNKMKIEFK